MEALQSALGNCGLTVSNLPDKGRCIFTTRDFSPGEALISQDPYVSVPNSSFLEPRCDACFEEDDLKKCSRCQIANYCSTVCQKSEWKLHRLECQALSKLDKERRRDVTPAIRLMIRLYCRAKLQSQKAIPTCAMDNYKLVEALVSNMSKLDEKGLALYDQMASLVSLILQRSDVNIKEIAENFSKFACNAHTICDTELRPLATGLYPVISIINHSCLPNSILLFEGRSAVVRAVQHIPKGSEVFLSYIDTAASTGTRRNTLKKHYLFTCTCPRCIKEGQYDDIQETAVLEGYGCTDSKCDGFLLRDSDDKGYICQECGRLKSMEEIIEIESEIEAVRVKSVKTAESAPCITYQDVVIAYKAMETLERRLYHPFSVFLIPTWEMLIKNLMRLQDWSGALAYCRLIIPLYQRVYPGWHPVLGLKYYTCGKLEGLIRETDNSANSMTKAAEILQITHGKSSPLTKELFSMLEQLST